MLGRGAPDAIAVAHSRNNATSTRIGFALIGPAGRRLARDDPGGVG